MSRQSQPPKPPDGQANSRNEYIPSFISKAPFYATGTDEDYLEHQRLQSIPTDTLDKAKWYSRGAKAAPAATKFRKGACANCGALTHQTKECLSRPRKAGAKWTGKDIQADEVISSVKLGWDAKRDRWNGYDAKEYSAVVAEYEELEAAKKAVKDASCNDSPEGDSADSPTGENATSNPQAIDSETRYAEETDMGRNQPTSTRQLRLREDTAKYLLDLNLDSQRYDPKTRSMDPAPSSTDNADDGFARPTLEGDAADFERAQRYAWETQESATAAGITPAQKLHLQANPTEGSLLLAAQSQAQSEKRVARSAYLESTYGNSALLPSSSTKSLLTGSTSQFVEYDESGAIKGRPSKSFTTTTNTTSKYPEDIHPGNHSSTFGSWWTNFQWGYACCHSLVRNSYCTGEEGRRAFELAESLRVGEKLLLEDGKGDDEKQQQQQVQENGEGEEAQDNPESKSQQLPHTDPKTMPSEPTTKGAKKRTLKELRDGITEEEMEGYKKSRVDASDPMVKMLGKDELKD